MLYRRREEKELDRELFREPTAEYRGTPFWAWNGKLSKEVLEEQIGVFEKMGLGGFHMHVRTGLDTPYLGEEYLELIRYCVEEARDRRMLAWLYDEDRWPSGTAGGKVTAGKPENARKTLLFTKDPYEEGRPHRAEGSVPGRGQESVRQDNGVLLAVYDIVLDGTGCLKSARQIREEDRAEGSKWYAYLEHATADPWFNDQAYLDTLRPEAVREFLQSTHEVYREAVGKDFGGVIPAIFTDEPQFAPKETLAFSREEKDLFLPWTDRLPELYRERFGEDLLEALPQLVWELPEGELSGARWRYQNLVTDLFVASFPGQIGRWCREHGIALTGHVMGEPTLESQTQAVGDAMRCYPEFDIPGIDMLCDFHEYTTAKQAQSMKRQCGAEAMLSELYGVTGWDCDFRTYKLQGDWQAALGVTVRVPHLAWMTMKGEAKRDYPASISYQSPWWERFSLIEDHFARLNTALTRGKDLVKTAVVHPIESFWLCWGPGDKTGAARREMDRQFAQLTETLLFGGVDFDFLCEARLPEQCPQGGFPLQVGAMAYETVIVPPVRTLRASTLARLEDLRHQGGRVIFLGACPDHIDAKPSGAAEALYREALRLPMDGEELLNALDDMREVEIRKEDGSRADRLLCQARQDGEQRWLFLCTGKNPVSPDVDESPKLRFRLKGEFCAELYDTMTGEIKAFPVTYEDGNTCFERVWHLHNSLLLRLTPGRQETEKEVRETCGSQEGDVALRPVKIRLTEPNMLLLDLAEYSLNGGAFFSEEEVLRIDNKARQQLGIPLRRKEVVQPYLLREEAPEDRLCLRFRLESKCPLPRLWLGLEDRESTEIRLNGVKVDSPAEGYYVDRCIGTVELPGIPAGTSVLELEAPIGRRTNLEACYLLGDFGVRIQGTKKVLTAPVRELGWGDIAPQGLPFYTGNLEYETEIEAAGTFTLRVPQYRGGLVGVLLDGKDAGSIAFSPYALEIPAGPGRHTLTLRLYGTRQNGFGQLHHTQGVYFYQSPNSWRSDGDLWSYEYCLKPAGILKSPELRGAVFLDGNGEPRRTAAGGAPVRDRS